MKISFPVCAVLLVMLWSTAIVADGFSLRIDKRVTLGAILGGIIGYQIDEEKGAVAGAIIGSIAGSEVSRYQRSQKRELEAALRREQLLRENTVQRLRDETLNVRIGGGDVFDPGSAVMKSGQHMMLNHVAETLLRYDRTVVHIVGHTDSSGPEYHNTVLSLARAQDVARYLLVRGVPRYRMIVDGRGEIEPLVSNDSAANRQLNRRVEIYVKPVINGSEGRALESPHSTW